MHNGGVLSTRVTQRAMAHVVKRKECGHPSCNKQPVVWSGRQQDSKTANFCAEHNNKKEGMVSVKSKRCGHPGCNKCASHGVEGSKTVEFCAVHVQHGMGKMSRSCGHPICNKGLSYGVEGSKKKEFCAQHKKEAQCTSSA